MTLIDAEDTRTEAFLENVGLALIVAGVFATFKEGVLARFDADDSKDKAKSVADEVHLRLQEKPLDVQGIRLVAPTRKGYSGYYDWVMDDGSQKLFFAGRSVLHRIDADFRSRHVGTAEEMIARRLSEGADVRVMFVDPRSDLVPRLASEERQERTEMLADIAYTIGVCERLHQRLGATNLPSSANLDIRVFDEIPYFAYHCVGERMIVGFYFSSSLGHASSAYAVVDTQTQRFFEGHFESIFLRAAKGAVLDVDAHRRRVRLGEALIRDLRTYLEQELGEEKARKLLNGEERR